MYFTGGKNASNLKFVNRVPDTEVLFISPTNFGVDFPREPASVYFLKTKRINILTEGIHGAVLTNTNLPLQCVRTLPSRYETSTVRQFWQFETDETVQTLLQGLDKK